MSLLRPQDLFIVGPTASGKSQFAINIASKLNLPIVNSDSLQFFSSLKIGTAYPSPKDFNKAEHLLFGVAQAGEFFSAGEFIRRFEVLKDKPENLNRNFLIVGGSGFYIKALETGMEEIEVLDEEMKHKISFLKSLSPEEQFERLKEVDPKSLEMIHINDHYRVQRALEVFYSQGVKMSEVMEQSRKKEIGHAKLGLYLERDQLLKRVHLRVEGMMSQGLVDEVQGLVAQGLKDWKPLQSVGYKEVLLFLEQQVSLDEMKALIVKNTMLLAKKQMTWFRADPKVVWFQALDELDKAENWAEDWFFTKS